MLIRIKEAGQESNAPFFPIEKLKEHVLSAVREATTKGAAHIRDPVGGSNANLFVSVTAKSIVLTAHNLNNITLQLLFLCSRYMAEILWIWQKPLNN